MEPSSPVPQPAPTNYFCRVTPLSKYLAMALFVLMPFIGGYVGYTYAPVKVVEVEKLVIQTAPVDAVSEDIGMPAEGREVVPAGSDTARDGVSTSKAPSQFVEQDVAVPVSGYSDKYLRFSIGSQREMDDNRAFIDYLNFDADTGLVSLQGFEGDGDFVDPLLRLYKKTDSDIEKQIEDIALERMGGDEAKLTKEVRAALQDKIAPDQMATLSYRTFCKLYTREDSARPGQIFAHLNYDKEGLFKSEPDDAFDLSLMCGHDSYVIFKDLIVQNVSYSREAAESEVNDESIRFESNTL